VLSGSAEALAPVLDLRAAVFVNSLTETGQRLREIAWTIAGSLGSTTGLLARDPDRNLIEFVEVAALSATDR
jgi:hypothetical protein